MCILKIKDHAITLLFGFIKMILIIFDISTESIYSDFHDYDLHIPPVSTIW